MAAPTPTIGGPHPDPSRPRTKLPAGACDAHCHVFGPHDRFPYAADASFVPPDVPVQRLEALHDLLGFERTVIVQSACHGRDHAALLDAIARAPDRRRGVALITPDTPPEEVAALDAAGVRGFRVNVMPHLGPPPSPAELDALLALAAPHDWQLELHVAGAGIVEFEAVVAGLDATVVVDHLARVDLAEGLDGPAVLALERLLDAGHVWVKLSAADRIARRPDRADAGALMQRLIRHAPERVVWGTDFPHPNIGDVPAPDEGALVDLLGEVAGDEATLERVLVANPAALYGFAP